MNEKILLNVYDDEGNIVKQCEATDATIKFGAVRSIMKLTKIEENTGTYETISIVSEVWDKLTAILNTCFPDMEEEDWDNVEIGELVPVIISIVSRSFSKMSKIPVDKKN